MELWRSLSLFLSCSSAAHMLMADGKRRGERCTAFIAWHARTQKPRAPLSSCRALDQQGGGARCPGAHVAQRSPPPRLHAHTAASPGACKINFLQFTTGETCCRCTHAFKGLAKQNKYKRALSSSVGSIWVCVNHLFKRVKGGSGNMLFAILDLRVFVKL